MAKVTDLLLIQQMADSLVDEKAPTLVDRIGHDKAVLCLVACYTTNDICSGYGQDFWDSDVPVGSGAKWKVSVISFLTGVSVIDHSHSSRYQDRFPMCGYVDLADDITQIAISIQAAFDRIQY